MESLSLESDELVASDGDYRRISGMNLNELWVVFWIETVKLWEIGGPIALNIMCQYGFYAITVAFCGHLGPTHLAAVTLAQTVIATFSYGFMSKVGVPAWIGFVALLLHALLLWLFIYVFNWGLTGAAISLNLVCWSNALAQFAYVVFRCKDGWKGWSWSAFHDIWPFVKLSIQSAIMLSLEIWFPVSIVLITGYLKDPVTAVGSLSICSTLSEWQEMFFIGINAAISVRVSNELGLGHARTTKYSVYVTLFQSLLIGILCMIVVLAVRNHLAILFIDNKVLIKSVSELSQFLGVTMLLSSVHPVISGIAVGCEWQGLVTYINLGSFYAFAIPLGYVLGFVSNLGVMGLWGGMIAGLSLQTLLLSFVLCRIDWNKEVEQSAARICK